MKRKTVMALMLGVALAATGCAQNETKETTKEATEAATTEAASEEEKTEAATTEAETTEAETTEAATTEAETEEETTEAAETETEEETTEAAETETEEETTEATETETETEEETTEAAETEEETTEAAETETEEETTEAVETETEEETTEAAETETEEETTEAVETETEEETTEAVETESETGSEEETTEAVSEEETTEAGSEEETSEAESETETEAVSIKDMPSYTASEYVTLGEYKGLQVTQAPLQEITDEDVQSEIDYRVSMAGIVDTLTEGTIEEGDTANIDYEGTLDGVAFDGGTAEGYDLTIGSGSFIDGFEDGLIGVAVGEEVDLNLTFPEDYQSEDLAGQEVVFHVKVNSISRQPEFSDEVASQLEEGKTADEYTADIRAQLEEDAQTLQQNEVKTSLLQLAAENAEITGYPEEKVAWYLDYQKSYYVSMVEMYGMEFSNFLTSSGYENEDAFMTEIEEYYKPTLEQEMVLMAIAEKEAIEISEEEFQTGLEKYAADISEVNGTEISTDELLEQYGEAYVRESLILDKTMEFLVENAEIVEEEATEAATEEETTEAASEEITEAASEEETTEAVSEEAAEEETTEAVSEAVTEEATTEAAEEETTEAVSETEA